MAGAKRKFKSAMMIYLKTEENERIAWTAGASAYMAFASGEINDGIEILNIAAENGYSDIEKTQTLSQMEFEGRKVKNIREFRRVCAKIKKNIFNDRMIPKKITGRLKNPINYPAPLEHAKLKKMVPDLKGRDDIETAFKCMSGVHRNLRHDPSNRPVKLSPCAILKEKNSFGFTCREFAILSASIMQLNGICARAITILKKNYNYGYGKSHWVCEAWIDSLNKWILLDPQNNCCWKVGDVYLNGAELRELKRKGSTDGLDAFVENKRTPELKSWLEYFDVIWIYKNQNFNKGIDAKAVVYELSNVSYKYFQGVKRIQKVFKSSKRTLYASPR